MSMFDTITTAQRNQEDDECCTDGKRKTKTHLYKVKFYRGTVDWREGEKRR